MSSSRSSVRADRLSSPLRLDLAFPVRPEFVAENSTEYFTTRVTRYLVDNIELGWDLKRGDMVSQEKHELAWRYPLPRPRRHECVNRLSPALIWDADQGPAWPR